MCFIALFHHVVPDYPVLIAANRDESPDRPGTEPRMIRDGVYGGVDPRAGGTWLALSTAGRVAAVSNRRGDALLPGARSRGRLCVDMLDAGVCIEDAVQRDVYNPFNLLVVDADSAWVATYADGRLEQRDLSPGICMIGNTTPDATDEPKLRRGRELLTRVDDIDAAIALAVRILCDDEICVHGGPAPTVSSSIIAIHKSDRSAWRYLHAQGAPDRVRYREIASKLAR